MAIDMAKWDTSSSCTELKDMVKKMVEAAERLDRETRFTTLTVFVDTK
jgi:hypothetical protein